MRYANQMDEPDEGEAIARLLQPVEYKGITGIEIGTLWAILDNKAWDVNYQPEFVHADEEGESWLYRFPVGLTKLLASADDGALASASSQWAKTEELNCDAAELRPLLDDLRLLAQRAANEGKSIYLWGCL